MYGVSRHLQFYFSYIMSVSFIGGGKKHRPWQINDKLYQIIFYLVLLAITVIRTHNLLVICIDC